MTIDEIENMIMVGSICVYEVEHDLDNNQFIITYRAPSNRTFLCNPPRPVPDTFYRVVYGDFCVLNIQVGQENITPEHREIVYT